MAMPVRPGRPPPSECRRWGRLRRRGRGYVAVNIKYPVALWLNVANASPHWTASLGGPYRRSLGPTLPSAGSRRDHALRRARARCTIRNRPSGTGERPSKDNGFSEGNPPGLREARPTQVLAHTALTATCRRLAVFGVLPQCKVSLSCTLMSWPRRGAFWRADRPPTGSRDSAHPTARHADRVRPMASAHCGRFGPAALVPSPGERRRNHCRS